MTQVVLNISSAGVAGISQFFTGSYERAKPVTPSREIIVLGIILALMQVADGVLTAIGMSLFGTGAEGNALLRFLMEQLGFIPALVLAKSFAVIVTCILCLLSNRVQWIRHAMKGVIGVYLLAAVIPWTVILLSGVL
jgi:hypothetical protein